MLTDFISLFGGDTTYLTGRCYTFAMILSEISPGGNVVYDPIHGHFLYEFMGGFYDVTGEVSEPEEFHLWEAYPDEIQKKRIYRDCVMEQKELTNEEVYCMNLFERVNEYNKIVAEFE